MEKVEEMSNNELMEESVNLYHEYQAKKTHILKLVDELDIMEHRFNKINTELIKRNV